MVTHTSPNSKQKSNSKLVSVLLLTYNRENLVGLCINSILAQTYTKWELIICDDGSVDNTPIVARKYAEMDPRIRYHRNNINQGLPKNRNIAISLSRGKLIFFAEDDSILEPDCLGILVKTFEELKSKGIKVGAVAPRLLSKPKDVKGPIKRLWSFVGDSKRKTMKSPSYLDKWTGIVYRNFSSDFEDLQEVVDLHALSLFSKDVCEEIGGYDAERYKGTYMREEADFYFRMMNKGYKLFFQPKAVVHHNEVDTGGCSNFSLSTTYYYYFLRNHIIFVIRNFGWKSLYMIPFFLFFIIFNVVRYGAIKLRSYFTVYGDKK